MKRTSCLLICFSLLVSIIHAQVLETVWEFDTSARILAGPVVHKQVVYIGNEAGIFFALNTISGKQIWKFQTGGNIQAKATIAGEGVFFESANVFYLLSLENGALIWKYDIDTEPTNFVYNDIEYSNRLDPYDDKHSVAAYSEGVIYAGAEDGKVYGFNAVSGEKVFEISAINNAPVRSSPLVQENKLYFGDWNGRVYKYDMELHDFEWVKKTYRGERPYYSFGSIVSEFLVHNDKLFFGARNHMLNVLLDDTGEKEWTYTDPNGGWIIGDPVIEGDTLYMGGSDNTSMFAFYTEDGRVIWSQNGGKNIYAKALLVNDYLIYTAGDGYDINTPGKVTLLNKTDGTVLDEKDIPMGVFSPPVHSDGNIYFGSYDGNIYCFLLKD